MVSRGTARHRQPQLSQQVPARRFLLRQPPGTAPSLAPAAAAPAPAPRVGARLVPPGLTAPGAHTAWHRWCLSSHAPTPAVGSSGQGCSLALCVLTNNAEPKPSTGPAHAALPRPHPACPGPPQRWALPVHAHACSRGRTPGCPQLGGRAHGWGRGGPRAPHTRCPPCPRQLRPSYLCVPAEPSQLLAAPALPPDTRGAGDTGAGHSGYSCCLHPTPPRSRPRPARPGHCAGGTAGTT